VRLAVGPLLNNVISAIAPIRVERDPGCYRRDEHGGVERPAYVALWVRGIGTVASVSRRVSGAVTYRVAVPGGVVEFDSDAGEASLGFTQEGSGAYGQSYVMIREWDEWSGPWQPTVFDRKIGKLRVYAVRGADVEAFVRAKHGDEKTPYEKLVDIAEAVAKPN
jgi:hypothetical protein